MKRRGFLGLLGLAPAAPLIANELTQVRPATANDHVERIKRELTRERTSPPCWQLQPLDENQQPWMGEWPREADCAPVLIDGEGTGETDLSITLPMTNSWIGQPMPAYVRTYFYGKPMLTLPSNADGLVPFGSITITQRVKIS